MIIIVTIYALPGNRTRNESCKSNFKVNLAKSFLSFCFSQLVGTADVSRERGDRMYFEAIKKVQVRYGTIFTEVS